MIPSLGGTQLVIPAFTKGKDQLYLVDIEETRGIANVRIHVERVIGLLRRKCSILSGILPIGHFQKYHNTLCLSLQILKSIAFIFPWDHSKSQEKMETMFMQNFGGTNKEYYGIFESGLLTS